MGALPSSLHCKTPAGSRCRSAPWSCHPCPTVRGGGDPRWEEPRAACLRHRNSHCCQRRGPMAPAVLLWGWPGSPCAGEGAFPQLCFAPTATASAAAKQHWSRTGVRCWVFGSSLQLPDPDRKTQRHRGAGAFRIRDAPGLPYAHPCRSPLFAGVSASSLAHVHPPGSCRRLE